LDVGAGDAWFAEQLQRVLPTDSEIVCWDLNYTDEDLARGASRPGLSLTAEQPTGPFDRILLLDVVEHVPDDRAFLKNLLSDLLAPGGRVLVSVPAYQWLAGRHDAALGHYRRYSPRQARALLDVAGLERTAEGGLFHLLLAFRAMQVLGERLGRGGRDGTDEVGEWTGGERWTAFVTAVLRSEARLSFALGRRKTALPGLSYWALSVALPTEP
jgi:hypothetical protein